MNGCLAFVVVLSMGQGAVAEDPFGTLNQAFHATYRESRSQFLRRADPVLLTSGPGKLVLLHNGTRYETGWLPPLADVLKSVSHVPLSVYAALVRYPGAPPSAQVVDEMTDFAARLSGLDKALAGRSLSAPQLERQRLIVSASQALIAEVQLRAQRRKPFPAEQLQAFVSDMRPLVYENIRDVAQMNVASLHQQVTVLRGRMDVNAWNQLRVVVMGSHMARQGELTSQYFLHLFHEHEEGQRVIFYEGSWNETSALELLGTHLIDTAVSKSFFGDVQRMHRDLLGDAAMDALNSLGDLP